MFFTAIFLKFDIVKLLLPVTEFKNICVRLSQILSNDIKLVFQFK